MDQFDHPALVTNYFAHLKEAGRGLEPRFTEAWVAFNQMQTDIMPSDQAEILYRAIRHWDHACMSPDTAFLNDWQDKTTRLIQDGAFSGARLVNLLRAHSRLGAAVNQKFTETWCAATRLALNNGEMGGRDIGSALWSTAVQDALRPDPLYHNLAYDLMAQPDELFNDKGLIEENYARHYFGLTRFPGVPWRETGRVSHDEKKVVGEFGRVAQNAQASYLLGSLGHKTDGYGEAPNGTRILLEYDGHSHFNRLYGTYGTYGKLTYNGSTILMTLLIQGAAPDAAIWRVPETTRTGMAGWGDDMRDTAWQCLLAQAAPGAYVIEIGDHYSLTAKPLLTPVDPVQIAARAYNI